MKLTDIFLTVCEMGAAAAVMSIVVLIARLFLKKLRSAEYILWAAVFIRLLCPLTFTSDLSVIPRIYLQTENQPSEYSDGEPVKWQDEIYVAVGSADINISDTPRAPHSPAPSFDTKSGGRITISGIFSVIWLIGTVGMAAYGVVSYLKLRRRLKNANHVSDNIFQSDNIGNAFIIGIVRPRIYIPAGTSENDMRFIILHENAHIRRGDHIAKLIMYIALCIHWFNPIIWLAFRFGERAMELYCDSRAAKKLSSAERADYCQALVNVERSKTAAFTVCFGESGVKQRVKSLLSYKKLGVVGAVLCVLLTLLLLLMLTGSSRVPVNDEIGFRESDISHGITFEADGKAVSYGGFEKKNIRYQSGEIGKFAEDFYSLKLTEVSEDPIVNVRQKAKIYFDRFEITLLMGEDTDGESAAVLTSYDIKMLSYGYFTIPEYQCSRLLDDVYALLDYEDKSAEYDTSPVERIIACEPFKVEKSRSSYIGIFSQEERSELMDTLAQIEYTPLDKTGLTLFEDWELIFYTENGTERLTCVTAQTKGLRNIECVLVDGKLYRIDNIGKFNRTVRFTGQRILAAEYMMLRPSKFSGFTLTVGEDSADFEAGAMESRTGMEGDLHTVEFQINKSDGVPSELEGVQYPYNVFRLDCHMGDETDSIILTNAEYGVHTRYYMFVIINCENSHIDKGNYCYEICEEDYNRIIESGKRVLEITSD